MGYSNETGLEENIGIVKFGTGTELSQDEAVAIINKTKESWSPIWSRVPMTWYSFDAASLFQQGIIGFIKDEFGLTGKIMLFIANILFTISIFCTRFAIEIMLIGFNSQLIVIYGQEIIQATAKIWDGGQNSGIRNTLLLLVLTLSGFYYIFRLLQARFSDIIRAALITVFVLGLSAVYFANTDKILTAATDVIDSISGAVFSVMVTDEDIPIEDPQQRGQIAFASKVWDIMVVSPWAYAQFGTLETSGLKVSIAEKNKLDAELELDTGLIDIAKANLSEGTRIDQILLALPPGSTDRQHAVNIFQDKEIDHGAHPQTTYTLSPFIAFEKFLYSFIALIGSLIFTIFACFMGALLFIADVTVIFSLAIAPFIAVVAIIPETGWGIAMRWFKALLSALFAKIFYGIYVGMLFLIIGVILTGTSITFLFKMLMLCIVLIFGFFYRKKLIDTVSEAVTLNGEQKAPGGRFISTFLKHKFVDKLIPSKSKLKNSSNTQRSNPNNTPKTPPGTKDKTGNKTTEPQKPKANTGQTPASAPSNQTPKNPSVGKQELSNTPVDQKPASAPSDQTPKNLSAGKQELSNTPVDQKPASAPSDQTPKNLSAGKQELSNTPAGQTSASAPGKQTPKNPSGGKQEPGITPAGQPPASAPSNQTPVDASDSHKSRNVPTGQVPATAPANNQQKQSDSTGTDNQATKGPYRHSPVPYTNQNQPGANNNKTTSQQPNNQSNHQGVPQNTVTNKTQQNQVTQQETPKQNTVAPQQNNEVSKQITDPNKNINVKGKNRPQQSQPSQSKQQPGKLRKLTIKKPSDLRRK